MQHWRRQVGERAREPCRRSGVRLGPDADEVAFGVVERRGLKRAFRTKLSGDGAAAVGDERYGLTEVLDLT